MGYILFVITRILDLFSTYLNLGNDFSAEANPLVRYILTNVGWFGLIFYNLLICLVIANLYFRYDLVRLAVNLFNIVSLFIISSNLLIWLFV